MKTPELNQAVILAGGLGTRLRPLTDDRPKPMIEINDRPFLAYLLEQLVQQGFTKLVLLLGYLPQKIQEYLGDGSDFGISVTYSISPLHFETGPRLAAALNQLDPYFLLMYCDNYWPFQREALWQQFLTSQARAQLVAYSNTPVHTRDNLRLDADNKVLVYDKKRELPALKGVDIGYAIIDRQLVEALPTDNLSFEAQVYPALARAGKLHAYLTQHLYYSIGSLERLAATRRFLSTKKVVFLDRDGVINQKAPRWEYIASWEAFEWLPGSLEALHLLHQAGYQIFVVTNQAGIARGIVSRAQVDQIHAKIQEVLQEKWGFQIHDFYLCPHGWDEGCNCRKPKAGMLFQAQREWFLDLTKCSFVGDSSADMQAAEQAQCQGFLVTPERSLLDIVKQDLI